jgi:hypothetical protein
VIDYHLRVGQGEIKKVGSRHRSHETANTFAIWHGCGVICHHAQWILIEKKKQLN